MPILKPISGHGSVGGIKRYLEKKNRALAKDLFNLSWDERGNCNDPQENKEFVLWDVEMDVTRASAGHNEPWKGKQARTFKHFVISPDPQDRIDLEALRELASSWVLKHFPDNQIAIIYHDDNEGSIPHAHIVVNSTDLRTGRRMHTDHPEDLNRDLQDMAREMGLTGLSNEMPKRGEKKPEASTPRSRQAVYFGRAEKELMASGNYSWVGDIRARVALAKNTSRSEKDFLDALSRLGIEVADNSKSAKRDDWIFSLADEPSKKVSGERLGYTFGKQMLRERFGRQSAYHPAQRSEREIRSRAIDAVRLNDLNDLSRLSAVLETCAKFDIRFLEDFDSRLATLTRRGNEDSVGFRRLVEARVYVAENELMTRRNPQEGARAQSTRQRGRSEAQPRQRAQEVERMRTRERGER